jgi:hypothetical protein
MKVEEFSGFTSRERSVPRCRKPGDSEEPVGGFSHCRNDNDRVERGVIANDGCYALNGCGGLDGRAAKLHDDHRWLC